VRDSGHAKLEGEITFSTVRSILDRSSGLAESRVLDLSAVTLVDSAGLALLLELTRRSRDGGGDLVIEGANPNIKKLASFFGLDEVLSFKVAA